MPQPNALTEIRADDLITSVADALQYISYFHPPDFLHALHQAYLREESPAAKDAMAQLLVNSRMCALGQRPICQDTGLVVVFVKVGMQVRWDQNVSLQALIDEGVRRAYQHPDNPLRASMVSPPIGQRKNTGDNTPAVVHVELVPGNTVEVRLAAKGGGSENKARFAILNPSDSLVDWVLETLPKLGAGWCPPGMLGIGIGGSAEKAMLLAKEALLEDIDLHELRERGPADDIERLRLELHEKINALGIGAQGLGGLTTVLDVKIRTFPTHAASLPVALIPNCAATRHLHFTLDGSGPADLRPPQLEDWPVIDWDPAAGARRVNLDGITHKDIKSWRAGERLLLSGRVLTARDAAHKRILELLDSGQPLPAGMDLADRFIYYVGPVDAVRDEVVGPAGPTTSTRMDKFTPQLLARTGLIGMIGKAERGPAATDAIKQHGAVYLMAVGGAAYLVAKAIRQSRLVAFEELGMEAVREFQLEDMPVIVAVDSSGEAIHQSGPREWKVRLAAQSD
ncbi:fumarate hydratase [Thiorhodovibrio frisius]|uniref:Fumarate hydratase class I n=1 Tax=Thiorhodovibrio frisius TaxID=631362 RepID=H8Z6S3_9GAMM|nr:fumarate hydratase [Thiorhodovibrio frisius]EIC20789.1 hydro-lyase, Fe-S type, tartrate/fumarate subfamily [Thiorhodovibrio frisius]WPL21839.1 Fumarate hydratase class I, aerobic [Thiorhodovibrio frisius]